jgi:formylglycine-generating enzyme required for sulfatase activity
MSYDVFISYSSKDKIVADAVVAALEKKDIRCWYAPRDIQPGTDWGESITHAISDCGLMLLIFSKNSNRSKRVLDEIYFAISEEKTMLPFRIENLDPSGAMRLHLSSRHWLDAYDPSWEAHINKLVNTSALNLGLELSPSGEKIQTPAPSREPISKGLPWKLIGIILAFVIVIASVIGLMKLGGGDVVDETPMPVSTITITKIHTPEITLTNSPTITLTYTLTETFTPTIMDTPTTEVLATMVSPKDGVALVYVPAGEFEMGTTYESVVEIMAGCSGCDINHYLDSLPQHTVYLDAFWIDRTEVTNQMYAVFLNEMDNLFEGGVNWLDSGNEEVEITSSADNWIVESGKEKHPVFGVSWYGARAYCEWVGRRLPTDAEWEKAARGTDARKLPWGDISANSSLLNYDNNIGWTTEVGSYPDGASPYGALDMAGNVWEWVADWYGEDYYENSPTSNPPGPDFGATRILRSGSWSRPERNVLSSQRSGFNPDSIFDYIGFRCALSD